MQAPQIVTDVATQPKLAVVIPIPKPTAEPITQADLAEVVLLRRRVRDAEKALEAKESEVRAQFDAGAPVEEGYFRASLKEEFRRNVAWKAVVMRLAQRLKLNPEAYCANVLEHTAPTRSVSLVIE